MAHAPPPEADKRAHQSVQGKAWAYAAALAAVASFVCMDVTIKLMSPRYGALDLAWLRFASGSVFAVMLWAGVRALARPALTRWPDAKGWRLHVLRGGLLIISITTYFFALKQLPLITAVTVSYIAPVFVALLAMVFLRERPDGRVWVALAFGFVGVVISGWAEHAGTQVLAQQLPLAGSQSETLLGVAAGVASAMAFAGVLTVGRLQAQRDPIWTLLLVQNLLALLACSLLMSGCGDWFGLGLARAALQDDWSLVAAAGLFATTGVLCLTFAFARLEANRVAPLEYTGLVWAALLGYGVLGEQLDRWDLAAALLVLAGCTVLLRKGKA